MSRQQIAACKGMWQHARLETLQNVWKLRPFCEQKCSRPHRVYDLFDAIYEHRQSVLFLLAPQAHPDCATDRVFHDDLNSFELRAFLVLGVLANLDLAAIDGLLELAVRVIIEDFLFTIHCSSLSWVSLARISWIVDWNIWPRDGSISQALMTSCCFETLPLLPEPWDARSHAFLASGHRFCTVWAKRMLSFLQSSLVKFAALGS